MDSGTQLFKLLFSSEKGLFYAFSMSVWRGYGCCSVLTREWTGHQRLRSPDLAAMSVPQRKICYLRRISMVRDTRTNKERLPSSSPLNYTKCWSLLDHCHFRLPLPSSLMSIKVILRVTLTHRLCLAGFRKTAICCNRALFAFWSSLSISLSPEHRENAPWLWELQGNRPQLWRRGHVG